MTTHKTVTIEGKIVKVEADKTQLAQHKEVISCLLFLDSGITIYCKVPNNVAKNRHTFLDAEGQFEVFAIPNGAAKLPKDVEVERLLGCSKMTFTAHPNAIVGKGGDLIALH